MLARIEYDPARGPGHAIIKLPAEKSRETDINFSLRGTADGAYLGTAGKLEAEQRLCPDAVQYQGADLHLLIGPAFVDKLDALDTFALTLYPANGESRRYAVEIGELVYSRLSGGAGLARAEPVSPPAEKPAASPHPAGAPPEPPVETPPEPPLPLLQNPVKHKNRLPLILLLLLLLLGGGAAAWMLLRKSPPDTAVPAPPTQEAKTEKTPAEAAPAPAASSEKTTPAESPTATPLQRVREYLRAGGSAGQSLELAGKIGPEHTDARFLLLEDAAQKGNADGMLGLARFYDPNDATPKGSIMPDSEQARIWYEKAAAQGKPEAEEALNKLHSAKKPESPASK